MKMSSSSSSLSQSKTFSVVGNSKELNERFFNSACEKLNGKKSDLYPGMSHFVSKMQTSTTTLHVYFQTINIYDTQLILNLKNVIIVDDDTKEDTGERLTVESWKKCISSMSRKPVSFIVVKDCSEGDKVSPGEITQDGVIRMSISEGINVSLPFKLL